MLNVGDKYYFDINNSIVEVYSINNNVISYILNNSIYKMDKKEFLAKIEVAGNRKISSKSKKTINIINDKIIRLKNNNKELLKNKSIIEEVTHIIFGKKYKYTIENNSGVVSYKDSGVYFDFNPLVDFNQCAKEILPWFNIHGFLYHFEKSEDGYILKITSIKEKTSISIIEETKSLCLLKGLLETEKLYNRNIEKDNKVVNRIAKHLFKNKKIELKQNYYSIIIDNYTGENIKFSPLTNESQSIKIILAEIEKKFNYSLAFSNNEYQLNILDKNTGREILKTKNSDFNKVICYSFYLLIGGDFND